MYMQYSKEKLMSIISFSNIIVDPAEDHQDYRSLIDNLIRQQIKESMSLLEKVHPATEYRLL